MSSFLINPYVFAAPSGYDPDAADYISRVETADGQSLETAVTDLINDLFVGLKADGIFAALKASCIMAGARTLAGALTPLLSTMPAPTNVGFVAGDYDRKTGLKGNGSTKYLNSNRNNNADPQDNQHMSVYATTPNTGNRWYIGSGISNNGSSHIFSNNSTTCGARSRSSASDNSVQSNDAGLIAISRDNGADYIFRNTDNLTVTRASQTPYDQSIGVYVSLPSTVVRSDARLAFYSIGESLDLALLDARFSAFMSSLAALSL